MFRGAESGCSCMGDTLARDVPISEVGSCHAGVSSELSPAWRVRGCPTLTEPERKEDQMTGGPLFLKFLDCRR